MKHDVAIAGETEKESGTVTLFFFLKKRAGQQDHLLLHDAVRHQFIPKPLPEKRQINVQTETSRTGGRGGGTLLFVLGRYCRGLSADLKGYSGVATYLTLGKSCWGHPGPMWTKWRIDDVSCIAACRESSLVEARVQKQSQLLVHMYVRACTPIAYERTDIHSTYRHTCRHRMVTMF